MIYTPQIIGLTGRKRSGKTTIARMIEDMADSQGLTCVTISFADGVRDSLLSLDPMVLNDEETVVSPLSDLVAEFGWEGVKNTVFGTEIRRMLQRMGTEVGRTIHDDVWVDVLDTKMCAALDKKTDVVIVPDIRFVNEAEYVVNELGFSYLIRVTRPDYETLDDHPSETQDIPSVFVDAEISNRGSLDDLHRQVEETLGSVGPWVTGRSS